ncbi:hypothetical protein BCR44DRAFT_1425294 [Catenaria anguillulae PL171]|uniref:Uncharacterized protein n=1 Tax=Catenaria anguillulae PL171 TaxID=765915 RepID=A0A1Y2I112_9FUNG|nr:hypothetical protein BCR44DRAFT_1425294 [Catenaria anguillulae PL171]
MTVSTPTTTVSAPTSSDPSNCHSELYLLTIASVALAVVVGKQALTPLSAGVPAATLVALLLLSWSVARARHGAYVFILLVALCLYCWSMVMFGHGNLVTRLLGNVPGWAYWTVLFLLGLLHLYFGEVLIKYAVKLRDDTTVFA